MDKTDQTIAVAGATGQQGGAVAAHLLAQGWRVRALTRDPSAPPARALARAGAEVVPADMADRASLDAALAGAYGVFSVQPAAVGVPVESEIHQGRNVADAAAAAGVRHLVYTSVSGADRRTGVSRYESKGQIERRVGEAGVPATILRPVSFMENLVTPGRWIHDDTLADLADPDRPVQLVAVADIGAFAALAFLEPDAYVGVTLELAGDELTHTQAAAAISRATGRTITYRQIPPETAVQALGEEFADDVRRAVAHQRSPGGAGQADIAALRERHPGLMSFEAWLARVGVARLEVLFAARVTGA